MERAGNISADAGTERVAGGGNQRTDPLLGDRTPCGQWCIGVHADVPVDRSRRAPGHLDPGVSARVPGPFRRREADHAAKHDQGDRRLEHDRRHSVRGHVAKALGSALQRFVSVLEDGKLHEPLAFGHHEEFRFETSEHRIDVGIEIGPNLVEPDLKETAPSIPSSAAAACRENNGRSASGSAAGTWRARSPGSPCAVIRRRKVAIFSAVGRARSHALRSSHTPIRVRWPRRMHRVSPWVGTLPVAARCARVLADDRDEPLGRVEQPPPRARRPSRGTRTPCR